MDPFSEKELKKKILGFTKLDEKIDYLKTLESYFSSIDEKYDLDHNLINLPLYFKAGKNFATLILNIIILKDNYELQLSAFNFFMSELLKYEKKSNNNKKLEKGNFIVMALRKHRDALRSEFLRTKFVDFSLFIASYKILFEYHYEQNYEPAKYFYDNNWILQNDSEKIIEKAHLKFELMVPFLTKTCVFGIGVYLNMLLCYGLKIIGIGLTCNPVHEEKYNTPISIFRHDIGHHIISVNPVINNFGKENLREIFIKIMEKENRNMLLYYIFILIHENQSYIFSKDIADIRNIYYSFSVFIDEQISLSNKNIYIFGNFFLEKMNINIFELSDPPNWLRKIENYDSFSQMENYPNKIIYYLNTKFREVLNLLPQEEIL